jgi:hypothetical protein
MKLAALFFASSTSFLSALDPGCGAGAGANVANGPDSTSSSSSSSGASGASSSSSGDPAGSGTGTAPGASGGCASLGAHDFCEDFDRVGTSVLAGFDLQSSVDGTLALEGTRAASAPNALLAVTTATNRLRTLARLEKKFTEDATQFQLSYQEWIDPSCVGPYDGVETGTLILQSNTYYIGIRHGNPDAVLETSVKNGLYTQAHQLKSSAPRGRWSRLTLDVDLNKNTMALSIDGNRVMENEPLKYPPSAEAAQRVPGIAVGTLTDNGTWKPSACQVRIDDVTFDSNK